MEEISKTHHRQGGEDYGGQRVDPYKFSEPYPRGLKF